MKTELWMDEFETPIGRVRIGVEAQGALAALEFVEHVVRMEALLHKRYGEFQWRRSHNPAGVTQSLQAYFDGAVRALDDLPVSVQGTPFQRHCWLALRRIPAGDTASYAEQARWVGRPGAYRAVGQANGLNPVALVLPCHRVIGSNRTLTGYASGLDRKLWLLAHERRHTSGLAHA